MVGVFRRSASLTTANPNPKKSVKEKAYHVRSISLPCRTHPLVSNLQQEISTLHGWQSELACASSCSSRLHTGLSLLEQFLHGAFHEILQLPSTQDCLRAHRSSAWASGLLESFLRLADAFGCFREALVTLQQLYSDADVALRRKDEKSLVAIAKSKSKVVREMTRLAAELRDMGRADEVVAADQSGDVELIRVMVEAKKAMTAVSKAVFAGFAMLSTTSCSYSSACSSRWRVLGKRSKVEGTEEEREKRLEGLRALEECNLKLETGSERVLRCLLNTRVSLLNFISP